MVRKGICVFALLLCTASLAQAGSYRPADREQRWEGSLQTRYTPAKDFEGQHGSKLSLEDDLGWGFAFGYNLSQQFNMGFSFAWRTIPYRATIVNFDNILDHTDYSNWLDTSTIALNGEFSILKGKRLTPFVSGSLGWTFIDSNIYAGSDYACWWDPWYGQICGGYDYSYGTDAASWSGGGGVRFDLTPEAFVRLGYEHAWLDNDLFDGTDMIRVDIGALL